MKDVPGVRVRAGLACLLALLAAACGDSHVPTAPDASPSPAPAAPSAQTLTIRSGTDGLPVPGALVAMRGQTLRSDAAGQVQVLLPADRQVLVEVEADGFLPRRTRWGGLQDGRLTLWPRDVRSIGLTEEYTRKLAYTRWDRPVGIDQPMHRLAADVRRVSVVPSAEVRDVPGALTALSGACDLMTAATGIVFTVEERPGGDASVEVVIDPGGCSPWYTCTKRRFRGHEITGAVISYDSAGVTNLTRPGVYLHELGHVFGLEHSLRESDLMQRGHGRRWDFTDAEWLVMRMMLERPPGNVFPDDDSHLPLDLKAGAPSGTTWTTVACGLH